MRARRQIQTTGRLALVLAAVLVPRLVAAEPESVRIDYAASAGCPNEAAFLQSLRERTTRFRPAAPDEQVRRFSVRVTATASAFSGRLEIQSPDGRTAIRSVSARACDEVASALALMTALAIDPSAVTSGSKASVDSPAEARPEPVADRPPPPPSLTPVAPSTAAARTQESQPWSWSAGLMAHTTFALAPSRGYGGDLFIATEAPASSRLGPALRAGIFLNQVDVELSSPSGAGARFQWAAAALEGCPLRVVATGLRLAAYPCVAFRLGVLRGEGLRIRQPQQTVNLWSDVGPVLRLGWAMTARWMLEAQTALMVPLTRPQFEILDVVSQTTTTSYAVPGLGGLAAIGVAYRFR